MQLRSFIFVGLCAALAMSSTAIAATPAGVNRTLIRMDGAYLLGFGPRTAEAIHDLAASIYGQQADN